MRSFVLFACLLAAIGFVTSDSVPAILWGVETPLQVPALHQLTENEFSAIIAAKITPKTFTVVFQEPKLSTEDLSTCKLASGQTCFKSLSQLSQKTYLPNVENPINNLKSEFGGFVEHYVKSDGELNDQIVPTAGGRVFIQLDDDSFAESDRIIKRLSDEILAQYPQTLFIYTAKSSSTEQSTRLIRKQRDVQPKQETESSLFFPNGHLMIFLTHLSFRTPGPQGIVTDVRITDVTVLNNTEGALTATLTGDGHTLQITVIQSAGNWMVSNLNWDNVDLFMRHSISANMGFSYHCNHGVEFPRPDHLMFVKIGWQIQPNFEDEKELTSFGEAFDCIGFTSAGIWGGLFVSFLFLLILSYGISWMLDIRTMDRFDDPKGKTIIVSATD